MRNKSLNKLKFPADLQGKKEKKCENLKRSLTF